MRHEQPYGFQLVIAANQWAGGIALDRNAITPGKVERGQFVNGLATLIDLAGDRSERLQLAMFGYQGNRRCRNRHAGRRCELLDLAGNVRGMADNIENAAEIIVLPAKQDRARMEADARAGGREDARRTRAHSFDDGAGGKRSPQGVVLHCRMDAEYRHHPIALDTHDHAVEIVDRLPDERNGAVENVARVLWIEHRDEPGRADDIGKQDGGKTHGFDIARQSRRKPEGWHASLPCGGLGRLPGRSIETVAPHVCASCPHDSPVESCVERTG